MFAKVLNEDDEELRGGQARPEVSEDQAQC